MLRCVAALKEGEAEAAEADEAAWCGALCVKPLARRACCCTEACLAGGTRTGVLFEEEGAEGLHVWSLSSARGTSELQVLHLIMCGDSGMLGALLLLLKEVALV